MRAAIGLGSSIGDRAAWLRYAEARVAATVGVRLLRASRWYASPPMRGGQATGWFLNSVVLVETTLSPQGLLARCKRIETGAGRRPQVHWGDRRLDLDVLLVDGLVSEAPVCLPHPGIAGRPFVLYPLLEVWPDAVDPRDGRLLADLPPPSGPRATRGPPVAAAWPRVYEGDPRAAPRSPS